MSLTQPGSEGSQSLTLNLSSNNPFRKFGATSPTTLSPDANRSSQEPPPRPVSRNPFLDVSGAPIPSPPSNMSFPLPPSSAPSAPLTGSAAELFQALTMDDKPNPTSNGMRSAPPPPPPPYATVDKKGPGALRPENIPLRNVPMHRPTRSQEEAMRARRPLGSSSGRPRPPAGDLNIFADPESPRKSGERRARRNSESSIIDKNGKPLDPEEEKRRQERRRRERRHRERDREREAGKDGKPKKDRKLDIIDQLDATSIYGTGLFHHDGPFDACNPHRNRAGSKRAPMQAFPKDSLNNVLGGSGPLNKRSDHATFLGNNDEEAFKDYARGGAGSAGYEPYGNGYPRGPKSQEPVLVNPGLKVEPIHGEESLGLGTSTFLEGAPASRAAIQRRETDTIIPEGGGGGAGAGAGGGLGRKKSLAQKIRGISNNKRDFGPSGRITSPEGVYNATSPEFVATPNGSRTIANEKNPFFKEYESKEDKIDVRKDHARQGSITVPEPDAKVGRDRAPSSPGRGLPERIERRMTNDGTNSGEEIPKMGFMSRVKSLKGGRRRPERPEKTVPGEQPGQNTERA